MRKASVDGPLIGLGAGGTMLLVGDDCVAVVDDEEMAELWAPLKVVWASMMDA